MKDRTKKGLLIVSGLLVIATWFALIFVNIETRSRHRACKDNAEQFADFIMSGDPELEGLGIKVGACALARLPELPTWMCELHTDDGLEPFALPLVGFECH